MARDPVCGMQVNEQQAAGKSEHQGETYYFCSAGCKQRFDQDPQRYTGWCLPHRSDALHGSWVGQLCRGAA
jgi:YHS domain-containing protein